MVGLAGSTTFPIGMSFRALESLNSSLATYLSNFNNDINNNNINILNITTPSFQFEEPVQNHDFAYLNWQVVMIICTCALTISGTVLGNVLVCSAVAIVRKLRTPSNLLIVSLAVSDLLVAVLVMPLATAYEVKGRWVFGQPLCDMWTSLDVLLCTASILNLCMISIDRYFVITRPFQYAMKRTPARMTLMILSVWMLSAIISIPPLFGWKEPPKPDQCNITQNIGYQFYATIGAFYLPLVVMVVIYYRIYQVSSRIAEAEARSKPSNGHHNSISATCSLAVPQLQQQQQSRPLLQQLKLPQDRQGDSCYNDPDVGNASSKKRKTLRCLDGSLGNDNQTLGKTLDASRSWSRLQKVKLLQRFHAVNGCASSDLQLVALRNDQSLSIDKSPPRPKSSIVDRRSTGEISRSSCRPLGRQKSSTSSVTASSNRMAAVGQQSNASSSLSKECKATRTLGVIMGTFIACWLPFFILALIKPFCSQPVDNCIPHWLSALFLWLGFANSFLNPIIYARFNREFRKPFREILLLRCRGINRRLRSDTYAEQFGPPSQDRLMVGVGHSHYSSAATLAASRPSVLPGKALLKSAVVHYQEVQDRAVTKLDESCEMNIRDQPEVKMEDEAPDEMKQVNQEANKAEISTLEHNEVIDPPPVSNDLSINIGAAEDEDDEEEEEEEEDSEDDGDHLNKLATTFASQGLARLDLNYHDDEEEEKKTEMDR